MRVFRRRIFKAYWNLSLFKYFKRNYSILTLMTRKEMFTIKADNIIRFTFDPNTDHLSYITFTQNNKKHNVLIKIEE